MITKFLPVPSKLLLFGEHTVLAGSPALTMPLWKFCARLKIPGQDCTVENLESTRLLKAFYTYLHGHKEWFDGQINLEYLKSALRQNMFFESQIPIGYGLGSSASVCVAIYKAFGKTDTQETSVLKLLYSRMESFFHGKSSGMDPLTIHLNQPILADQGKINILEQGQTLIEEGVRIYLLDSCIPRNSSSMIECFQQEMQSPEFKSEYQRAYLPILEGIKEKAINHIPVNWELIRDLSTQQLKLFRNLIPEPVYNAVSYTHLTLPTNREV